MSHQTSFVLCVALSLFAGPRAFGQSSPVDAGTPAHIATVQGTAMLERNGAGEPALENMPLLEGDRIKTDTARLEVLLPDGSVLDLDRQTTVDLLSGGLVRLMTGRLIFISSAPRDGEVRRTYQVDTPSGSVRCGAPGEFRVTALSSDARPFLSVAVVRGEAIVESNGQTRGVRAGQQVQATEGQGVTASGTFNSAQPDAFAAWAEGLRSERVGTESNAYLPPDLQVYGGSFDRNGTWDNSAGDGSVWYPNVSADWRPYYDGGWQPYGWGWTWVGSGPWVWPTHHYGRWGHGARGWYWRPGAQWGPGWVSWGMSSDVVSWCPLGYDDSPVFSFSYAFRGAGGYDPWIGWTAVPYGWFGRGYGVPGHALRGATLHAIDHRALSARPYGPPIGNAGWGRRWNNDNGASPYDRAEAVAGQRGREPWGGAGAPGDRPTVAQRSWSTDPDSPYMRAQGAAGARLQQTEPGAAARMRTYDTRPFASPTQSPLPYPDRYQSPVGSGWNEPLGDVARRSSSSPARGGSRSYYLGPSQQQVPSPGAAPSGPASPANGPGAGPRRQDQPGAAPRSDQAPSTPASAPGGGVAAPRTYSDYLSTVRGSARTYSTSPSARPSSSRQGADTARPSGSAGARPSGAGADAARPSGSTGARPSGAGMAAPSHGGAGRSSGGGGPARGGRGR
jgi:hypothetical protein